MQSPGPGADLLVTGAKLVATCDADRRELAGGWVAITGGLPAAPTALTSPPVMATQPRGKRSTPRAAWSRRA